MCRLFPSALSGLSENPVIPHRLDPPDRFFTSLIFSLVFSVSFIMLYVLEESLDFFFQAGLQSISFTLSPYF